LLRDKPCLPGRTLLAAAMINQVLTKTATESLTDAVHWHAQAVVEVVGISSKFIGKVDRNTPQHTPANLDLHLIIDNCANHKLSGFDTRQLV
jgi:hypothetical protein